MLAVENGGISFLLKAGCEGKAQLGQASRNHGECKVRFRRGKRTHAHTFISPFSNWRSRVRLAGVPGRVVVGLRGGFVCGVLQIPQLK